MLNNWFLLGMLFVVYLAERNGTRCLLFMLYLNGKCEECILLLHANVYLVIKFLKSFDCTSYFFFFFLANETLFS